VFLSPNGSILPSLTKPGRRRREKGGRNVSRTIFLFFFSAPDQHLLSHRPATPKRTLAGGGGGPTDVVATVPAGAQPPQPPMVRRQPIGAAALAVGVASVDVPLIDLRHDRSKGGISAAVAATPSPRSACPEQDFGYMSSGSPASGGGASNGHIGLAANDNMSPGTDFDQYDLELEQLMGVAVSSNGTTQAQTPGSSDKTTVAKLSLAATEELVRRHFPGVDGATLKRLCAARGGAQDLVEEAARCLVEAALEAERSKLFSSHPHAAEAEERLANTASNRAVDRFLDALLDEGVTAAAALVWHGCPGRTVDQLSSCRYDSVAELLQNELEVIFFSFSSCQKNPQFAEFSALLLTLKVIFFCPKEPFFASFCFTFTLACSILLRPLRRGRPKNRRRLPRGHYGRAHFYRGRMYSWCGLVSQKEREFLLRVLLRQSTKHTSKRVKAFCFFSKKFS
jgi:hypothetical protein